VRAALIVWSSLQILEFSGTCTCHRSKNSRSLITPRNKHLQSKMTSVRAIYLGHIVKGVRWTCCISLPHSIRTLYDPLSFRISSLR